MLWMSIFMTDKFQSPDQVLAIAYTKGQCHVLHIINTPIHTLLFIYHLKKCACSCPCTGI